MPRALILDMNGVVVDDIPYHERAWIALAERLGRPLSPEDFQRKLSGKRNDEIFPELLGRPVSADERQRLEDEKEGEYRRVYAKHLAPLAGLVEFLAAARAAGLKLAVATSAPEANIDFVLDGLSLRTAFDAVVRGSEVTHGKPHPEIFLLAATRLGQSPSDCVVFEDSLNGVAAGLAAGMPVVGITTTHRADEMTECVLTAPDFSGLLPGVGGWAQAAWLLDPTGSPHRM